MRKYGSIILLAFFVNLFPDALKCLKNRAAATEGRVIR
jgi:hypothetical protein